MTKTIEEEIKEALNSATAEESVIDAPNEANEQASEDVNEDAVTEEKPRDADGKFKKADEGAVKTDDKSFDVVNKEEAVKTAEDVAIEAPVSLSGAIKAKWKELPADVRAEWSKRENDIHQMMTRHDGELRIGREMKEAVAPYMAIIQAEGGTPAAAVRDLLNTAYLLRTAQPMQKAALVQKLINQYGVDMSLAEQQNQYQEQNPEIYQLRQHIARLEQIANPAEIQKQLKERMEHDRLMSEVNSFSSDPANKYYEQVKAEMAALLENHRAADLKEAYEMACWARPEIRSTLLAEQKAAEETKRKSELEAKRKAASSVSGSPGLNQGGSTAKNLPNLEDDIRSQLMAARGQSI